MHCLEVEKNLYHIRKIQFPKPLNALEMFHHYLLLFHEMLKDFVARVQWNEQLLFYNYH